MKKVLSLFLSLSLLLGLAACGGNDTGHTPSAALVETTPEVQPVELIVFAAASMTETLTKIAADYKSVAPNVTLTFNFDSSGTLKTQIQEGADCDLFISAAQKQMDQLGASKDAAVNPDGLDFVLVDSLVSLLQNKVVLVVPAGNPAAVSSFEDVATDRVKLLALGNADVPVGQYAQEIFTAMGLWDSLNAGQKITFGTNVKEVTAQVTEAAVDCGVVYATDAAAAGLDAVAEAPADTHQPVVYPAAVLNITAHEAQARAFLTYLQGDACTAVFEAAGFSRPVQ